MTATNPFTIYTDAEIARWSRIMLRRFDYLDVRDYATAQVVCPHTLEMYYRLHVETARRAI